MTEKTLVPIDGSDDQRPASRRLRRERRAIALAEQQPAVPATDDKPDVVPAQPRHRRGGGNQEPAVQLSADAFVLPPRAHLKSSSTKFGRFLKATFLLVVLVPTVLSCLFYAFVASDQYAATAQFAVRSPSVSSSSSAPTSLLSVGGMSAGTEIADSFIVENYIHSREVVEALVNEANFLEIYSRPSADQYYRLDPSATMEQLVSYWQQMSTVEFDIETGIITMTVRAFRPADAEQITRKVVEKAEGLVNELSMRSREDTLNDAKREVAIAEARYAKTRQAVASYRGQEQEVDPTAAAATRQGLVGSLEQDVAKLEAQLTSLRVTMNENSPRVTYVRNQLDALRRQIATERLRVAVQDQASGNTDQPVLTERISRYEELLTDRDFAQKAYESAQGMLESARQNALKQQRYLAVFVRGTAPEQATYPEGIRWTLVLFGSLFLIWGAFAMIAAAIRDRIL